MLGLVSKTSRSNPCGTKHSHPIMAFQPRARYESHGRIEMTDTDAIPKTLVGILGSGLIGYEPFDRRAWSGISYFVFTQLTQHSALHRAFGVEVPKFRKYWLMLRNWNRSREVWRQQYYMSRA